MDDRNARAMVTELLRIFFPPNNLPEYSVTSGPRALSSPTVWTGFALHG
jgi:hypothetical protein